jgi:hypothetical protein
MSNLELLPCQQSPYEELQPKPLEPDFFVNLENLNTMEQNLVLEYLGDIVKNNFDYSKAVSSLTNKISKKSNIKLEGRTKYVELSDHYRSIIIAMAVFCKQKELGLSDVDTGFRGVKEFKNRNDYILYLRSVILGFLGNIPIPANMTTDSLKGWKHKVILEYYNEYMLINPNDTVVRKKLNYMKNSRS